MIIMVERVKKQHDHDDSTMCSNPADHACGFQISLFLPSQRDWAITLMAASLS